MNLKKIIAATCLITSSTVAQAETWFDDWNVELVDVIEEVQHYGGNGTCEYQELRVRLNQNEFESYTFPSIANFFLGDTTETSLTVSVTAPYSVLDSNGFVDNGLKSYACQVSSLPTTYVENRVVSQREVKTPIQPFATFARYEFMQCVGGTRNGMLSFGGVNGQNVKVRVSNNGFPNQTIYNGQSSQGHIAFNTSSTGSKNMSVKFGSGSSKYLTVNVPECGAGGGPNPF
ncbi:MAG: hypothetical protein ACJAYF_000142 [Arenicella sp.]|jgi:hypothetical protein